MPIRVILLVAVIALMSGRDAAAQGFAVFDSTASATAWLYKVADDLGIRRDSSVICTTKGAGFACELAYSFADTGTKYLGPYIAPADCTNCTFKTLVYKVSLEIAPGNKRIVGVNSSDASKAPAKMLFSFAGGLGFAKSDLSREGRLICPSKPIAVENSAYSLDCYKSDGDQPGPEGGPWIKFIVAKR